MKLDICKLIELPKIKDIRGNLSFIESLRHVSFDIKRVYYLYDIPAGSERGGHAHKNLHQLVIALSGSFEIVLSHPKESKRIVLNNPAVGLYICPMIWRTLENFSAGAVCLVLASDVFEEDDYFRSYEDYQSECERGKHG